MNITGPKKNMMAMSGTQRARASNCINVPNTYRRKTVNITGSLKGIRPCTTLITTANAWKRRKRKTKKLTGFLKNLAAKGRQKMPSKSSLLCSSPGDIDHAGDK